MTIQYIKNRTECFDDYFPCRKDNDCKLKVRHELVEFICRCAQYRNYGKAC
jgi:aerobic-type carbon monoxide dehydrogenase small subunit (CoxS/CutS family)